MLTEDEHIKVMDFGLAARLPHTDAGGQAPTITIDVSEPRSRHAGLHGAGTDSR